LKAPNPCAKSALPHIIPAYLIGAQQRGRATSRHDGPEQPREPARRAPRAVGPAGRLGPSLTRPQPEGGAEAPVAGVLLGDPPPKEGTPLPGTCNRPEKQRARQMPGSRGPLGRAGVPCPLATAGNERRPETLRASPRGSNRGRRMPDPSLMGCGVASPGGGSENRAAGLPRRRPDWTGCSER
jgi:hypothetical protein